MAREVYQDAHPEVDCPECGGAGFFGNGPYVVPCEFCRGTGVLIDDSVSLLPRKPISRVSSSKKPGRKVTSERIDE